MKIRSATFALTATVLSAFSCGDSWMSQTPGEQIMENNIGAAAHRGGAELVTKAWKESLKSNGEVDGEKFVSKVARTLARKPGQVADAFQTLRDAQYQPYNNQVAHALGAEIGIDRLNALPCEGRGAILQVLREEAPSPAILAELQAAVGAQLPTPESVAAGVQTARELLAQGASDQEVATALGPLFQSMQVMDSQPAVMTLAKSLPSTEDGDLYRQLLPKYLEDIREHSERLARSENVFAVDPSKPETTVKYQKTDLQRLGKASKAQSVFNFINRALVAEATEFQKYSQPDVLSKVMSAPLARPAWWSKGDDGPTLKGTTLFRPGFGNKAPTPAWLFALARQTEKLVVAYSFQGDAAHPGQLRRLTEYPEGSGIKVPDELNIYAIGSPAHVMQSASAGSDVLIDQLNQISQNASLNPSGKGTVRVIAHSQGNLETLEAKRRLERAGYEDVVSDWVALAPAFRGWLMADENAFGLNLRNMAYLLTGEEGVAAVTGLDPDSIRLPEQGQNEMTVFAGDLDKFPQGDFSEKARGTNMLLQKVLGGKGGDGALLEDSMKYSDRYFPVAYDHDHLIANPAAVDDIIRQLPEAHRT